MSISETQLEQWSHLGPVQSSKDTHEQVRRALKEFTWPQYVQIEEPYLQGSYRNSTNVRGNSDVDLVVELSPETTFHTNLSQSELASLGYGAAFYHFDEFREDVIKALYRKFGGQITEGNKSLKLEKGNGRIACDIVPVLPYNHYENHTITKKGITLWTKNEGRQIINYPKDHIDNGAIKNRQCNNWFKPTVRMFKNATHRARGTLLGGNWGKNWPSYFIECFIFNASNSCFGRTYQATFVAVLENLNKFLADGTYYTLDCQNGKQSLFGMSPDQWNLEDADSWVEALYNLWKSEHRARLSF